MTYDLELAMTTDGYISREAWPRRNVYWSRPSVCLCVYLSLVAFPHYCSTDPDVVGER